MDKNIANLRKAIGDFSILNKPTSSIDIPEKWRVLLAFSQAESIRYVISLWQEYYEKEFSVLLATFERCLIAVRLIELNNRAALLYTFKNAEKEYLNYIGYAPLPASKGADIVGGVRLPAKFSCFYNHIHDGWYEAETQALGLMPLKDLFWLADQEWGILDDLTVAFALDKVLAVFSNGAGGYLCWNFNSDELSGLVWWDDEEPVSVAFWDILDEWTAMGINDY